MLSHTPHLLNLTIIVVVYYYLFSIIIIIHKNMNRIVITVGMYVYACLPAKTLIGVCKSIFAW